MSETSIVAIVVALVSSGIWGAITALRKDKTEAPVKKRDADIAAAHTSQQMALSVAEGLREDLTRTQGDVRDLREEVKRARVEAKEARSEAHAARHENSVLWAWIRDIRGRWNLVRLDEDPPAAPDIH